MGAAWCQMSNLRTALARRALRHSGLRKWAQHRLQVGPLELLTIARATAIEPL